MMRQPDAELDALVSRVIGAAIEVHRVLGPGFLESVDEAAPCAKLDERSIAYTRQAVVEVSYKGRPVGDSRLDLLIERRLVVELKAVDALAPDPHGTGAELPPGAGFSPRIAHQFQRPTAPGWRHQARHSLVKDGRNLDRNQYPGAPLALLVAWRLGGAGEGAEAGHDFGEGGEDAVDIGLGVVLADGEAEGGMGKVRVDAHRREDV